MIHADVMARDGTIVSFDATPWFEQADQREIDFVLSRKHYQDAETVGYSIPAHYTMHMSQRAADIIHTSGDRNAIATIPKAEIVTVDSRDLKLWLDARSTARDAVDTLLGRNRFLVTSGRHTTSVRWRGIRESR